MGEELLSTQALDFDYLLMRATCAGPPFRIKLWFADSG